MTTTDYTDYTDAPSDDTFAALNALAERQVHWESEIASRTAELEHAQRMLSQVAENELPELMDKLGMTTIETKAGLVITMDEKILASFPSFKKSPKKAAAAAKWLRENGHSKLLKRTLSAQFAKGEDAAAEELLKQLSGQGLEINDTTTVHSATIRAFVGDKLTKGEEVPEDLFGVFRRRESKIKSK